ncbi:MAG: isochorismate synthase [Streptosporangiales bacterium]|nr:isochorismate synthase [Streptosporangiales bacterium]
MSVALGVPHPLVVRTVETGDSGDLLRRLPAPSALSWVHRGEGLVAWGEAATLTLPPGPDRFAAAERWLAALFGAAEVRDEVGVPGSGPVAFASFTYDPRSGGSRVIVPRMVIGRGGGRAWQTTIGDGGDPLVLMQPLSEPTGVRWSDGALPAPRWETAVATAVRRIGSGEPGRRDLDKVVFARDLYAVAERRIDERVLLQRLAGRYPDCYTFACAGLVGATPELLLRRVGDTVTSLVLAGSRARGATCAEDEKLGGELLGSAKDQEEHRYAADSVRDALAPLCASIDVQDEPELLALANVQHLATPVRGELAPGTTTLHALDAVHPSAAVCGTPTPLANETIWELEGMDRGRYAGPVGWIDADGNGEWGIALRCAQVDEASARLFAGCGIVADSDPAAELAEARAKFRAMQYALEG